MKRIGLIVGMILSVIICFGQENEKGLIPQNSADILLKSEGNLIIGGYGEIHYNQTVNTDLMKTGNMDVHRMVMLFGYRFNDRTQFVTELEFEHVKEVYVEQAFLQYKISNSLNLEGGLILTPMGIINEYHEPTTFNGVERPVIDNVLSPATWREIGIGINGNIILANLKYQLYVVNGFNGYSGSGKLGGKSALRGGRQKGAESFISSPNITGKVEFYGIKGLNVGLSGYFGNTQSDMYDTIRKKDNVNLSLADSSVVGISMIGIDFRYNLKAFQCRGQFYYTALSNTDQYNEFTGTNGGNNDLGKSMIGYYVEAGYNVLRHTNISTELLPFVRYSSYNLHQKVESNIFENPAYNKQIITYGLTWKMANGAVLKSDIQLLKAKEASKYDATFNAGIGVMF